MGRILVVANETLGGRSLIEAVRKRVDAGHESYVVCVPRTRPKHGSIIYEDSVYEAAQVRIDLARTFVRQEMGIEAVGEVGDPDPYTATMDAIGEFSPDEVIVSTKPITVSGWLRRDLVGRISDASGLPVEHVVTDLDKEGLPFTVTLVVANRTASTDALFERLRAKSDESTHLFIVVVPREGGEGSHTARARARLSQMLDRMRSSGMLAAGMIGDPDPYSSAMNATDFFRIDEIIISTLGAERSGWMRAHVVERLTKAVSCPVEHVVAETSRAGAS